MIFVKGLGAPETPRLMSDNTWICVEMAPGRGCVTHISSDGSEIRKVAETGMPNGAMFDKDGNVWVAETHPEPGLVHVTMDGQKSMFMDEVAGKKMLLPNDLYFGANGLLYMTDSGMLMSEWAPGLQLREDWATAPFDGRVYEIDVKNKTGRILDDGYRFTNGLAFGLDGHLYVNEMITGDIYRYTFTDNQPTGEKVHFANVMRPDWDGGFRGPDGMVFGADGNLYCTVFGQKDVTVIAPDGSIARRIETEGHRPTNVAFGPDGETRLYVTEQELGQIEVFDVDTSAAPIYYG